MASDKKMETRKVAVTTANQIVDWGSPSITHISMISDATTVRVDFDQPTDAGSFPLLSSGIKYDFEGSINKLHVSTSGGTANLYLLGVR